MSEPTATRKQINYLNILFEDLGISPRSQRNAWLESRGYFRELDLLTIREASEIISILQQLKNGYED